MNPQKPLRTVAAGAIGNILEWYDFAIYGYFAAAIGKTFFPREDHVAQVLAAFGIFAVGYLMRPLGGVIVGHIGDRLGRRAALSVSVAAMAIPTFLVGILPGYEVLGELAPILLTVLRVIQGLSIGGEYTTSIVFLVEHARPDRRGLIGAMASFGATGGMLLGSATGAVLAASMPVEALNEWGWRIPFLLGLLVGLAGFLLRRHVADTLPQHTGGRPPLIETVRHHGTLLARLAGLSVFLAVSFYLVFLYVVDWLQYADGIAPARALSINTASMLAILPVIVCMGWAVRPHRPQAGHARRRRHRTDRLLAAILADASREHPADHGRPVRICTGDRHVRCGAARHHGRADAAWRALYGDCARLQRAARHHRRPHAAGRNLAGTSHRQ